MTQGPSEIQELILREQQEQTKYLKRINSVMQLFGLIMILGIIGWCLLTFFGTSLL